MKPNLPKRLAARVRSAIAKVNSARANVIHYENRIEEDRLRISEYEADPDLFAMTYYPGHDIKSYPVTTTIEKTRENLEYRIRRFPSKLQELRELEAELVRVENTVLTEVMSMRATNGREPWPYSPTPLETRRQEVKEERKKIEEHLENEHAKQLLILLEEEEKQSKQQAEEDAKNLREYLAAIPPNELAIYKNTVAKMLEAFESGTLTPIQVIKAAIEQTRKRNSEKD